MAETNGSQFFPPSALCLQFPALQGCTEDLPLVLQRPDNFPLVMGMLQEINHDKVGFSSGVDYIGFVSQRPHDQQIQKLALSKVKLENLDVEDHYQNSCNSNPDLYQEWSLKGVEELLTDPDELQLRHDCYQQNHEAAGHLEVASAQDEKPSFSFHSAHSQFNQGSSDEALLLVDEKPALCLQVPNCSKEQVLFQGRALPVEEFSEAKPGLHVLQAAVLASNKPQQLPSQACVEDSLGLDNLQLVKREPEGHAGCSEAQMQGVPAVCALMSSVEFKEGGASVKLKDTLTTSTDFELNKHNKTAVPESHLQLNLETRIRNQWAVHSISRSTGAILALSAEFTEQEKTQASQEPASPSKSLVAEGPLCPTVSSEEVDGPQVSAVFGEGNRKHRAVSSEANCDFCELMPSLGSSQPETGTCPKSLNCHPLHEEKVAVENSCVQEEHHGQCQRSNPNQWQHATRCGSHKISSTPAYGEKLLFSPTTDEHRMVKCYPGGEGSTKMMQTTSKSFDLYDSSPDEIPAKRPLFKQERPSSPADKPVRVNNSCLDQVSRQTLQLMPQSSEDGGSALEKDVEEFVSEDDQLAEARAEASSQKISKEASNVHPSKVSPQSERASELKEPYKKRMRGTLPTGEKGAGTHEEKDTRCHRSDGKSWRCGRECINGAYYCQYHLRARRIGYNRRKNRDTYSDHLESVSKKSSKPGTKSRQLSSASNRNSKS